MTQPRERTYKMLSQDERDEMLAQTLLAQERDAFMHGVNLERFDTIIADPLTPDYFREHVTSLRNETASRIAEVDATIRALEPQLPDATRLEAAKVRIATREGNATVRG